MEYILERKNYYNEGDIVYLEYWYNNMLTEVRIVKRIKRKYLISHNVDSSRIQNAPDEIVNSSEIIDHYRN